MPKKIQKKCKKINLVISDVDGVLTDGGMYYSDEGEIMKKFNTRDGSTNGQSPVIRIIGPALNSRAH